MNLEVIEMANLLCIRSDCNRRHMAGSPNHEGTNLKKKI